MFSSKFKRVEGIYCFGNFTSETKRVSDFYTKFPFPNYNLNDDKFSIHQKGKKNKLAYIVKNKIGFNKKILEVGAGTCQLSNFFAIGTNNDIYALDPTFDSLKAGKDFADKNGIKNVHFVNSDIFCSTFKSEAFDLVWCNGVLHHTEDPYLGFKKCVELVKPGGYILIGLYNKYGRIRTYIRKYLYKIFGVNLLKFLDPVLRAQTEVSKGSITAWIMDQYKHPLESDHSLDEVLKWFKDNRIEVISSVPDSTNINIESLQNYEKSKIKPRLSKNKFERIVSQVLMLFDRLRGDGGLFIVLGRKYDNDCK